MSPYLRRLSVSHPRALASRASHVSALLLSAVALAAPLSGARAQQAANEPQGDLPPISVEQETPKPKSASASKAKPKKSTVTAKPQQPATAGTSDAAADGSTGQSGSAVVAGSRSGSLTVPNTAEARAEINRTPGGVDLVPDTAYKPSTPAATLKDALDYVPGVFVQPKWGEDTRLSIRGSGLSRNFHGRGVELLMDGIIPITTADGAGDFQEIDPTAYRYIEVYKGANALRYGANQLGGAINFVMPTGYDADLFGTRLDVGSFGFHKLAVSSGGVFGAADYFITGTWQEQDGFRDHSDGESVRGAMNVGYRLTRDLETRFYLNANHVRQRIPGAVTKTNALTNPQGAFVVPGLGSNGFGNDNVDRDYERNIDSVRVANRTTMRISPATFVEVGGFYFDRHLDHPIFNVIDNEHDEYGGFARISDERMIGLHKNRLVAGLNVHNGDVRARQYSNVLGERGALQSDVDQISKTTTFYAENSFFILPAVALVAGIQYADIEREYDLRFSTNAADRDRSAAFDLWNPKAGFIWDLAPGAQIFANVSRSTEAPTFSEISIVGSSVLTLDPQEATTYEIGTRGRSEDFVWDLSLYRANIDNEFQCLLVSGNQCAVRNADKTMHQGVELGFGAAIWKSIFVAGSSPDKVWFNSAYTYSDFRFDDDAAFGDNELPGAPRHYLRAELLYKHPAGVFFGPNVEWVPEAYYVDNANTLATEAYAIWDAKLGYEGATFTAYIEGRNLSDEAYISSASISGNVAGVDGNYFEPGNGRAVYGGIQMKW